MRFPGALQRGRQKASDQFDERMERAAIATCNPIVMACWLPPRVGTPDLRQAERELTVGPVRRTLRSATASFGHHRSRLEIAVEGGVFALIAFLWGLVATTYGWHGLRRENLTVGVAVLLYFLVSWSFIQTFPRLDQWRLDQWLSFWMALTVVHVSHVSGSRRPRVAAAAAES